ncbi:inactive peptidyl-prolyl cis-trans isomerase FKBP6-like [Diretmus argenteus]
MNRTPAEQQLEELLLEQERLEVQAAEEEAEWRAMHARLPVLRLQLQRQEEDGGEWRAMDNRFALAAVMKQRLVAVSTLMRLEAHRLWLRAVVAWVQWEEAQRLAGVAVGEEEAGEEAATAEEEAAAGEESPFHRLGQQMEDILGDGGILKEVFQPGEGPPVPRNASVSIRFSAFLEYCDRPFDTNCNVKHPQMMKLGRDVTLAGLELGLLTMRKGEFSRFLFKPQYAYGEIGCPPFIPSAATVLYEVQVLDFIDSAQVDDFLELSVEEQNDIPLSTLLKVVNTCRSFGNRCFKQSRYYDTKDNYKQAMTLLGNKETENDVEREKINMELLPLYMNLSLSELRLERPHKALKYAIKALEVDPDNTKALYRCGQAYLETHDYKNAQGCLIRAQAKKPFDSDINNLLKKVAICYKDSLDEQKEMYSKMFKGFNHPMKITIIPIPKQQKVTSLNDWHP